MENGIQMTLEEFMPEISQKQIVGASDSHALISQWQDAAKESLKERVHRSFSELCNFLDKPQKRKDPLTCSSRMLRICFLLMEDGISPEFSLRWMRGGTMRNGRFSTLRTSTSPKTGKGSLLSDILEAEVPQKYFLSKEQTERIVFAESSDTEKDSEGIPKSLTGGGHNRNT